MLYTMPLIYQGNSLNDGTHCNAQKAHVVSFKLLLSWKLS